ncbi:MAG TPA: transposase [Methylobacter sp.]|jgi:transposase
MEAIKTETTESETPAKEERITRVIRVEFERPLGISWDEFGQILRERRAIAHRLINASIIGVHIASKSAKEPGPQKSLRTLSYGFAGQELEGFKKWASAHKDKAVQKFANIQIPGGMQSAWAEAGFSAWKKWSKSNGEDGFPTMRRGQPIMLRSSGEEWGIELNEDGKIVLSMMLDSTRQHMVGKRRAIIRPFHHGGERPTNGMKWGILRQIAEGDPAVKRADLKITYDQRARRADGSRGKWYALIAYSIPKPAIPDTVDKNKVVAVHRGLRNLLTAIDNQGNWKYITSGNKLEKQRAKIRVRRRSLQDALKRGELGRGSHGHGRKRLLRPVTDLDGLERRITNNACRQAAAEIIKFARKSGCGTIFVGEYGGIEPNEDRSIRRFVPRAPLYELKQSIELAAQAYGIVLSEISEEFVSQDCHICGHRDPKNNNIRTGMFHCQNPNVNSNGARVCSNNRPTDFVSAYHMLNRTGCDMTIWQKKTGTLNRVAVAAKSRKKK